MRNQDFARLVASLAQDPKLLDELLTSGPGAAGPIARLVPAAAAARSPPGDRTMRIALLLAQALDQPPGRHRYGRELAPMGPCVDSCEASRLVDGAAPTELAGIDIGAILQAGCGGDVTCCCTSGTCGDTCGGSTCSVTCSGDSCGSTCGDSCEMTTNLGMRDDWVTQPGFGEIATLQARRWR